MGFGSKQMAVATSEFNEYWPHWPEGAQGETLAEIYLECSFDHLVELLWGDGSEFQVQADQARGFIEYFATGWTENIEDLPSLPGGFDWSTDDITDAQEIVEGDSNQKMPLNLSKKMRKVRFHNKGGAALLGQFFKNEELQRCKEFVPNQRMMMEACVCTTAPYCDRFRVICQYTLEKLHTNVTSLKIEFHIAYIKNVNGMAKVFMEKGARGGLQKNFEIYVETLAAFVPLLRPEEVLDGDEATLTNSSSILSQAMKDVMTRTSDERERPSIFDWRSFVSPTLSDYISSRAPNLQCLLPEKPKSPMLESLLSSKTIAHVACALVFLVLVKLILVAVGWIGVLLRLDELQGSGLHRILWFLDAPDSVGEVITAVVVLETIHWLTRALGDFLVGSNRECVESSKVVEGSQDFSQSVSELPQLLTSRRSSLTQVSSSVSRQPDDTESSKCVSSPKPVIDGHHIEDESQQPLLSPVSPQMDVSNDVVDKPTFIDNTVSFFKLGMVAAALSVELAISGMTKNRQSESGESTVDRDADEASKVFEEVFENERLQPFRGWGHTWPGHFLPTDKCGHWSIRQPNIEGMTTSMVFDEVAPQTPDGWIWEGPEWQIDRTGEDARAVDKDGWQYDFDFAWMKFPSEAGKGIRSHMKLVRRRRWIRTRVRMGLGRSSIEKSIDGLESSNVSLPQTKKSETIEREVPTETTQKAMSETSYFTGPPISKFSLNNVSEDASLSFAATTGILHRRHSSGATMDRYFSIEDPNFPIRLQCENLGDDKVPVDPFQSNDCELKDSRLTFGFPPPCDSRSQMACWPLPSLEKMKRAKSGAMRELMRSWSDSGIEAHRRVKGCGLGEVVLMPNHNGRGQKDDEARVNGLQGGNKRIQSDKGALPEPESKPEPVPNLCGMLQYRGSLDSAINKYGRVSYISSDKGQDDDEDSCIANDINWTLMEGEKWVTECLSSKGSGSGSPMSLS